MMKAVQVISCIFIIFLLMELLEFEICCRVEVKSCQASGGHQRTGERGPRRPPARRRGLIAAAALDAPIPLRRLLGGGAA